ncbi:MAP/microtubule affinity-regulating kinase 4-like [Ptychodera flava]|uniref:MAP/microtubule affinity-regulating kinase 4-like n=1 Tax=Ptychodera flava TaxID=63121 RepID=UPI00396A83AB
MDKYKKVKTIGRGAFGSVLLFNSLDKKDCFAGKKLSCDTPEKHTSAMKEVMLLSKLEHKHIVKIVDVITTQSSDGRNAWDVWLMMEYCTEDNLNRYMMQKNRLTDLHLKIELMTQMTDAVAYLHERNAVHRDLKPDNVLITVKRGEVLAKVSDFGLSRIAESVTGRFIMETFCGTELFMAPEIYKERYDEKVDVFSLGVIFIALLTNSTPRGKLSISYQKNGFNLPLGRALFRNKQYRPTLPEDISVSQELKDAITSMVSYKRKDRPAAEDILVMFRCEVAECDGVFKDEEAEKPEDKTESSEAESSDGESEGDRDDEKPVKQRTRIKKQTATDRGNDKRKGKGKGQEEVRKSVEVQQARTKNENNRHCNPDDEDLARNEVKQEKVPRRHRRISSDEIEEIESETPQRRERQRRDRPVSARRVPKDVQEDKTDVVRNDLPERETRKNRKESNVRPDTLTPKKEPALEEPEVEHQQVRKPRKKKVKDVIPDNSDIAEEDDLAEKLKEIRLKNRERRQLDKLNDDPGHRRPLPVPVMNGSKNDDVKPARTPRRRVDRDNGNVDRDVSPRRTRRSPRQDTNDDGYNTAKSSRKEMNPRARRRSAQESEREPKTPTIRTRYYSQDSGQGLDIRSSDEYGGMKDSLALAKDRMEKERERRQEEVVRRNSAPVGIEDSMKLIKQKRRKDKEEEQEREQIKLAAEKCRNKLGIQDSIYLAKKKKDAKESQAILASLDEDTDDGMHGFQNHIDSMRLLGINTAGIHLQAANMSDVEDEEESSGSHDNSDDNEQYRYRQRENESPKIAEKTVEKETRPRKKSGGYNVLKKKRNSIPNC